MKRFFIIVGLICIIFTGFAQQGAISSNGQILANFTIDQSMPKIFVYQVNTGKILQKIAIEVNKFDKISFSPSSQYITIVAGGVLYVYRRYDGRLMKKYFSIKNYQFSKNDKVLTVISNGFAYSYDFKTLKQTKYLTNHKILKHITISPDGRYIAALTSDNHLIIWRKDNIYPQKIFQASEAKFLNNTLQVRINSVGKLWIKTYQLPQNAKDSIAQINQISSDALMQRNGLKPVAIIAAKSSLSPSGSKLAIYQKFGNVVKISVFDLKNKTLLGQITNKNHPDYQFYPIRWTPDEKLVLPTDALNGLLYDYRQNKTVTLHWAMLNPTKSPKLTASQQLRKRKFSPNYKYVLMPVYQGARKFLLIRDATINLRQISYPDANYISFSPDSRKLFLDISGTVFYLLTNELSNAMKNNTVAELHQLGTTLEITEKFIPRDQPPPGYKYIFAKDIKPVARVDTHKLFVLFRGMNLNPKNLNIKLNLIDEKGNIITGATDPQWLYLWCKLLVMNKNLKVKQTNFIVKEVHENQPTAYAILLDQSGSMGDQRANSVQFGALQLIKNKKPQDAFLLIKYDNRVKLLVNLTKNIAPFYPYLNNTGLQGFGGGTAINDAAYLAIEKLKTANYPKKVILLFTDGKENSSIHTKDQVIAAANRYHIEIFTIGFGPDINEKYLMDLAYLTGGAYYHIYRTQDLKRIFLDVDLKRRYYYKFNFITEHPGQYIALLQMCQNFKHHDSVVIKFNNDPRIPLTQKHIQVNPPLTPKQRQILHHYQVPKRPPQQPVTDKKILTEFENIDFPNIYFAFNSDRIIKSEEKGLIEIANFMKKHPHVYLRIEGHTDSVGSYQYNIDLSKRRAEAAKRLLVKYGIAPGRIFTVGYGYTRPLASNKTAAGRAKNRRIEFKIFVYKRSF